MACSALSERDRSPNAWNHKSSAAEIEFHGSYLVAQLGARMHYAVPRILHDANLLDQLYTDICIGDRLAAVVSADPMHLIPAAFRRLKDRHPVGIPPNRITSFPLLGFRSWSQLSAARTRTQRTAAYLWANKRFCELIARRGLGKATNVYAFNGAALELFHSARAGCRTTVLEQTIAPISVVEPLLNEEQERYPGWEAPIESYELADEWSRREADEWSLADYVICGSHFVSQALRDAGVPAERTVVVPYGIEKSFSPASPRTHAAPLRVLVVGTVCLRKGMQYVLEAAKLLRDSVSIRVAGSVSILPGARRELERHVTLLGPVPRSKMKSLYEWADIFLLPSLCEGSATATYEALSCGLPVVTTRNSGSVVRDGVEGFLIPIRDPQAIATALDKLRDDTLRREISYRAAERSNRFGLEQYAERLLAQLVRPKMGQPI